MGDFLFLKEKTSHGFSAMVMAHSSAAKRRLLPETNGAYSLWQSRVYHRQFLPCMKREKRKNLASERFQLKKGVS